MIIALDMWLIKFDNLEVVACIKNSLQQIPTWFYFAVIKDHRVTTV